MQVTGVRETEKDGAMTMHGEAILALWLDVEPESRAECDDWYIREHIPDRVGLPGFRRARRYKAVKGAPEYLAIYEAETAESMLGAGYIGLLGNVNERSLRMRAAFRNVVRSTFRVTATLGLGEGALIATLRFSPAPGAHSRLREWLTGSLMPELATRRCIVGVHLWECDPSIRARMDEHRKTGHADAQADWVLLFEATQPEEIDAATQIVLTPGILARHGASAGEQYGVYGFLYGVTV